MNSISTEDPRSVDSAGTSLLSQAGIESSDLGHVQIRPPQPVAPLIQPHTNGGTGSVPPSQEELLGWTAAGATDPSVSRVRRTPLIELPVSRVRRLFLPLQEWEGVVLEVHSDYFIARLVDRTAGGRDEEAEIELEELSLDDRASVQPGAVFYWSIGYWDTPTRSRASRIRFRRLSQPSLKATESILRRAELLAKELKWDCELASDRD